MKNQSTLLRLATMGALVVMFVFVGHFVQSAPVKQQTPGNVRADIVTIDAMAAEGKLELPAVTFKHDLHTEALLKEGVSCSACHEPAKSGKKGEYNFSYKTSDELTGTALKDMYHQTCISCHATRAAEGKSTGPQEASCRSCHDPRPAMVGQPTGEKRSAEVKFDKLLHFEHINSASIPAPEGMDKNCAACHHVNYDKATGVFEVKNGKEESCRSCHSPASVKTALLAKNPDFTDEYGKIAERATLSTASHTSCINCHTSVAANGTPATKTGPVTCAGCHETAIYEMNGRASFAKGPNGEPAILSSVPRLERGQPDVALLLPRTIGGLDLGKSAMPPVAFDHKFHETVTKDCATCHGPKIDTCSSCHAVNGGIEKGANIPLAQAMHSPASKASCIGCHETEKQKPDCAGCHAIMKPVLSLKNKGNCATCHTPLTPIQIPYTGAVPLAPQYKDLSLAALLKKDTAELAQIAQATINTRQNKNMGNVIQQMIANGEIPAEVTLGKLSNEYEPSVFPHGKIIATLFEKQSQSSLATAFHKDPLVLCQACHHNSPVSKTPPTCISCHSADPQVAAAAGRPALKNAYHLQCMTCHEKMDQKPAATDCNSCHKPRVK